MNSIKINKCIKVTLKKCLNLDIKEVKNIIKDMNYLACKASNKAIKMWQLHTEEMMERKFEDKNFNISQYEKDTYKKSYRNVIEGKMKDIMDICNTSNVGTLHQQLVQNDWGRLKKDVLNYRANVPTYKLDTPYFIKNHNYKLYNNGGWFVDIAFFNKQGLIQYGYKVGHKFEFEIDKIDNNKKSTITKIINGEYKQGSAQISLSKKGKIELIISFSFEKELKNNLDKNRILGIDLGIVNTATMSIWDNNKQAWDWVDYKENRIDGKELIKFRQKLFSMGMSNSEIEKEIFKANSKIKENQLRKRELGVIDGLELAKYRDTVYKKRREMSIASKYAGKGRSGHGRKTKMKPVDKIRNKVYNFADTYNHKYSKYIVDFAVKHNCGIIQMEDLSNATANKKEKFLKDWSYFDLQTKIEYKAKEYGIEVIKINPKYTSKRCSKCGGIHIDNRDCQHNQANFECKICGHKENADINASRNISIPYIDKIIAKTKVQAD
nr:MAG TPA: endonuclease [Caudoviricetes sp.]